MKPLLFITQISRRTLLAAGAALAITVSGTAFAAVKATSDNAILACQNKSSGALSIKSKCSTREKRVSWNKKGVKGAKGDTGARGPAGPSGSVLSVKDSTGKNLGQLIGMMAVGPKPEYAVLVAGRVWTFDEDGRVTDAADRTIYFENSTCTGDAYVSATSATPSSASYVTTWDGTTRTAFSITGNTNVVSNPADAGYYLVSRNTPECDPATVTTTVRLLKLAPLAMPEQGTGPVSVALP